MDKSEIKIYDIDVSKYEDRKTKKNHPLLPQNNFRMLICAPSSGGKTHLIVNLLLQGLLQFDKIFVFSPSIGQAKYLMLKDFYDKLDEKKEEALEKLVALKNLKAKGRKKYVMPELEPTCVMDTSPDDFKLDELDQTKQNLIILDDLMLARQSPMINLFSRSRHKSCSLCYLSQSYYQVPKTIRQNCSCFIIFSPITKRELTLLKQDVAAGVDEDEFCETLKHLLRGMYKFVKIDLLAKNPKYAFTSSFNHPLFLSRLES